MMQIFGIITSFKMRHTLVKLESEGKMYDPIQKGRVYNPSTESAWFTRTLFLLVYSIFFNCLNQCARVSMWMWVGFSPPSLLSFVLFHPFLPICMIISVLRSSAQSLCCNIFHTKKFKSKCQHSHTRTHNVVIYIFFNGTCHDHQHYMYIYYLQYMHV